MLYSRGKYSPYFPTASFFKFEFFIGTWLVNNAMLVSGVKHSGSLICVHVSDLTLSTKVCRVRTVAKNQDFPSGHVWM